MLNIPLRATSIGRLCALALAAPLATATPQSQCTLSGDVAQISLSAGGQQTLSLAVPFGVTSWQMLGSASGDAPGSLLYGATPMALNIDRYYLQTFSGQYRLIEHGYGTTDLAGHDSDSIVVPPGSSPALAGVTLHHAFYVIDPLSLLPACASNSVAITFVP